MIEPRASADGRGSVPAVVLHPLAANWIQVTVRRYWLPLKIAESGSNRMSEVKK